MLQYYLQNLQQLDHGSILLEQFFIIKHKSQQLYFLQHHEYIYHVTSIQEHHDHFLLNTQQQSYHIYFNMKDLLHHIQICLLLQHVLMHNCYHLHLLLLLYPNNYLPFHLLKGNYLQQINDHHNNILQYYYVSIFFLVSYHFWLNIKQQCIHIYFIFLVYDTIILEF